MSVDQKFNMLLAGEGLQYLEESQVQTRKSPRKRISKDEFISKFKKSEEVKIQKFEKDALDYIQVFSSDSIHPEALVPTDT